MMKWSNSQKIPLVNKICLFWLANINMCNVLLVLCSTVYCCCVLFPPRSQEQQLDEKQVAVNGISNIHTLHDCRPDTKQRSMEWHLLNIDWKLSVCSHWCWFLLVLLDRRRGEGRGREGTRAEEWSHVRFINKDHYQKFAS